MSDTIGRQKPDDIRGWLTFEHLPDGLQRAEDATQAADRDHAGRPPTHQSVHFSPPNDAVLTHSRFTRPATGTERTLLQHLGFVLPEDLQTQVHWISAGVRQRTWPQLEGQ